MANEEKDNAAQTPRETPAENSAGKSPESGKRADGASQRARRSRNRRPKPAQGESAQAGTAAEQAPRPAQRGAHAQGSDSPGAASADTARKQRPGRTGRTNQNDRTANDRRSDSARRAERGARPADKGRAATARPTSPAAGRTGGGRSWADYLVQLAIVILGVAITLLGSGLIEHYKQKRQEREVMRLVVEELRENRRQVEHCTEKLICERRGLEMLGRYGYAAEAIPGDSLAYCNAMWSMREMALLTDAVEVLKGSDFFSSTGDRDLVMRILGCYEGLNRFAANVAQYNAFKFDALKHYYASGKERVAPVDDPAGAWKAILQDAMCRSFVRNAATFFGYDDYLESDIAGIERTVGAIREKYGFE
ncbi:hypothetical protein [Alistipes sp.]|uniref:hypothetical protein n=1 Tax=Alistipes sp. TaxID=1872444 RepID=UPI003AF13BDE